MSKAVRDFIVKTKITKDGPVIPGEAEQAKLRDEIQAILEQAINEGHRIASLGAEERGLISTAKGLAGRAVSIVGGIVKQIRNKIHDLYDPNLENPYNGWDIKDWAEDYGDIIGTSEISDTIGGVVLEDLIEQGVSIVSWVAEDGACPICQDNADASPLVISSPFPSGDYHPPAHPRCRCHLERDVILKDSR